MENSWETLIEHDEDDSLKTPQVYKLDNVTKLYRAFRIKTTDTSLAGTEILALGAGIIIFSKPWEIMYRIQNMGKCCQG